MSLATDILKRAGDLPAAKRKITCKAPVKPVPRRVQSEPSGVKALAD